MIELDAALYITTTSRIVRLEKRLSLTVLPRLGEQIKFRNDELGDYFSFTVTQVTHREGSCPEIWAQARSITKLEMKDELWSEEDLDGDVATFLAEGWTLSSDAEKPNRSQPARRAHRVTARRNREPRR